MLKRIISGFLSILFLFLVCGCEISSTIPPYIAEREKQQKGGENYNPVFDDPESWRNIYDRLLSGQDDPRGVEILNEYFNLGLSENIYYPNDAESEKVLAAVDPILTYLYHYDFVNDNSGNLSMASGAMTKELANGVRNSKYFDNFFENVKKYHVQHLLDQVSPYQHRCLMDCGNDRYLLKLLISSQECALDGGFCAKYPWKNASNLEQYYLYIILDKAQGGTYQVEGWIQNTLDWNLNAKCYTIFSKEGVTEEYHDKREGRLWEKLSDMTLEEKQKTLSAAERYKMANLVDQVFQTWYVLHPEDNKFDQLKALLPLITENKKQQLSDENATEKLLEYTSRADARQYVYDEITTTAHINMKCDVYSRDNRNYYWCSMTANMAFSGDEDALAFLNAENDEYAEYTVYVLLQEQDDESYLIDDWGIEFEVSFTAGDE